MEDKIVCGIGIYMSRFGEIVYCNLDESGYSLEPVTLEPIARIIARSKQDRLNKYLAMPAPEQQTNLASTTVAFDVYKKNTEE